MARKNFESILTEVTIPGPDSENECGYRNMFASVWLKTELLDDHEEYEDVEQKVFDQQEEEDEAEPPVVIQEPIKKTLLPKSASKRQHSKELKCKLCDYTTTYKNCLDLHVLGHAETKAYRCKECSFATKLPTSLQRHMKCKHGTGVESAPTVSCKLCDYTTIYKWNLRSHMRKHDEQKLYKCAQCEYVTAYKHNYEKHCKTHNNKSKNVVFKCDKCHFKTKFMGHITRHLAKIHNEITDTAFRCAHCDFSTITKWRLNIHIQRSAQKELIQCLNCDFKSFHMCEMKKHKNIDHYNTTFMKTIMKDVSQQKNEPAEERNDQYELPNHIYETENDNDCGKAKKRKRGSGFGEYNTSPDCVDWKSIKVLECEDKDKPFQCVSCKYSSRFKASVQRHYQRHHTGDKIRPYQCLNCDFSTKTKDQIALHNKRSKSDIIILCKECDFKTEYKCTFVVHQKTHYAYTCSNCSYKCKTKYDLSKHYTCTHMGEVWKCQYCEYTAPRRDTLLSHETVHTGYKPYACGLCDFTSIRKSLLNIHLRRFHSDMTTGVVIVSKDKIDALKTIEESGDSDMNGYQEFLS